MARQTPLTPKCNDRTPSRVLSQAAALPWYRDSEGKVWVLLIRRCHKRRWGIPKGIIEPGQTDRQAAIQEAREEAGVRGDLSSEPIGEFEYEKWGCTCRVGVFVLHVTREDEHYEEESFRERRWFRLTEAQRRKCRKGIRPLLSRLASLVS